MSPEDFHAQADILRRELTRIRDLMDEHNARKLLGVTTDESSLIKKVHADLNDVLKRFDDLDAAYRASALPQG